MEMEFSFQIIKSFAIWQNSSHDAFNRTKADRMMKRKIPVTNPQQQTCFHGEEADIKMIVHVADAVESFH